MGKTGFARRTEERGKRFGGKAGEFLDRRNMKDMSRDALLRVARTTSCPGHQRLNPPHGIPADDGKEVGDFFDLCEHVYHGFRRCGALELDHEAVFLEAAGDGARENLGQVELATR